MRQCRTFPVLRALAAGLLLAAALGGCGLVETAYDHGETLTMVWAERYIDFDARQEAFARARIDAWFKWHRTTQLPDYARLGSELEERLQGPVTMADMMQFSSDFRERYHTAVDQALPDLAELAASLRLEQLPRLEAKFADNDATYRSDFVDVAPARAQQDRYEKLLDRVQYWYGELDESQKRALRAASDALPVDPALWLAERKAREQELVAILEDVIRNQPPRDEVIASLKAYSRRIESSPDATRRAYIDKLNHANLELYVMVANFVTPEQRAHAVHRLHGWVTDSLELARN